MPKESAQTASEHYQTARTAGAGDELSPLVPSHAFVVQFRAGTEVDRTCCTGRVEHVVSSQAALFASLEDLWTFIARVLTHVRGEPGED